jgi:hypothetical protein
MNEFYSHQRYPRSTELDYYLLNPDGSKGGPYSIEQVRAMWSSGAINLETLMWTEGMADWQPLRTIEDSIRGDTGNHKSESGKETPSSDTDRNFDADPKAPVGGSPAPDSTAVRGTSWQELVAPPLIDGASGGCLSTIMMAIDSMERDDYEGGLNLFRSALAQNHTVVSGWLGIAYAEALLVSTDRNTRDSIRLALAKVHEFAPRTQQIFDHEGLIWTGAFSKAGLLTLLAFGEAFSSMSTAKSYSDAVHANTSGRNGAIAIAVAGAVLGGSAGLLGKVIGYGVSAAETYRAINSHGAIKSGERALEYSANRFAASCQLGIASESLVLELVKEAEEVYPNCSPEIQQIIDSLATEITKQAGEVTKGLAVVKEDLEATTSIKTPQSKGCGTALLAVFIAVAILVGFILLLSLFLGHD